MMIHRRRELVNLVCNGYASAGHTVRIDGVAVEKDTCSMCSIVASARAIHIQIHNANPFILVTLCDSCLSTLSIGATDPNAPPLCKWRGLAAICKVYEIIGERVAITEFGHHFVPACFMCGAELIDAGSRVIIMGRYTKLYFDESCISPFVAEMELRRREATGRFLLLRVIPLIEDVAAIIRRLLCAAWISEGGVYDAMFP